MPAWWSSDKLCLTYHETRFVPDRSRCEGVSNPLAQPRQHLQAGVTVGGREAGFALKIAHRQHGLAADAAVGAVGIEARGGEAALDLLHLGQGRRALAAGERLHERAEAADAVAEMDDGKRVVERGIVGFYGEKILGEQKGRPAVDRAPQARRLVEVGEHAS